MNPSLSFWPTAGPLSLTGGKQAQRNTQAEVIKASSPQQFCVDVWGRTCRQRLGRKAQLFHLLSLSFFLGLLLCTVVEKSEGGKRPLSPGNRSCATQMVPSLPSNGILSYWVPLCYQCTDHNLGSSLPSSASLSLFPLHTHRDIQCSIDCIVIFSERKAGSFSVWEQWNLRGLGGCLAS